MAEGAGVRKVLQALEDSHGGVIELGGLQAASQPAPVGASPESAPVGAEGESE
jgi:hypothetical protein